MNMEYLLSKITQQAMNYAIRSGIGLTASYALKHCARLVNSVSGNEKNELASLHVKLESKVRIISPAIDMIELISARGNTSLESAVTLTKAIRSEIQSLGLRIANLASLSEEITTSSQVSSAARQAELLAIKIDMKQLLEHIEDAVPLINLAITTCGVNLSTNLPATVSPSRLLQASTFLTAGDNQYNMSGGYPVQIGPTFTLSLYMLFVGHANKAYNVENSRETMWKEVIHKARVRLTRVPISQLKEFPSDQGNLRPEDTGFNSDPRNFPAISVTSEFAYQILIIEDFNDDRVHTFDNEGEEPSPFEDVEQAGIREIIPIHEISKIFYADTGKILNIGGDGEVNNPVLLLKRDINAIPPRRMLETQSQADDNAFYAYSDSVEEEDDDDDGPRGHVDSITGGVKQLAITQGKESENDDSEAEAQLLKESTMSAVNDGQVSGRESRAMWKFPQDLDQEWLAFEVYSEEPEREAEDDVISEELSSPPRPSNVEGPTWTTGSVDQYVSSVLSFLHLESTPVKDNLSPGQKTNNSNNMMSNTMAAGRAVAPSLPPLRTSLSLLELLIRLTSLQQFQQQSHLAISDEFLNFFLGESSTVGAGGDAALRQRVRGEARKKIGFDPYDESPVKLRSEEEIMRRENVVTEGGDGEIELSVQSKRWMRMSTSPAISPLAQMRRRRRGGGGGMKMQHGERRRENEEHYGSDDEDDDNGTFMIQSPVVMRGMKKVITEGKEGNGEMHSTAKQIENKNDKGQGQEEKRKDTQD